MTQQWVDRVIFNPASGGTGDFVVASAVTGYLTPAQAGAVNGALYHYAAELKTPTGTITDWEVGTGIYTSGTTTLARTTVEFSSASNAKISFSSPPNVMVTVLAADLALFTSTTDGRVPLSGGGSTNFLRADSTWSAPTGDLSLFTSSTDGRVPSSGGGTTNFLRADGTWNSPTGGRASLLGNTSYYVDAVNGNDSTGTGAIGAPWKTLTFADNYIQTKIDLAGFRIDLILQAGTYAGVNNMGGYVGGGTISLHGITNVPSSYIIQSSTGSACLLFNKTTSTTYRIDNVTFQPTGNAEDFVQVRCNMLCTIAGNFADGLGRTVVGDYSAISGTHASGWTCTTGGRMEVFGFINITVPVGANYIHVYYLCSGLDDNSGGNAFLNASSTVTFSGNFNLNPSFSAFAHCDSNCILASNDVFGGGVANNGTRFLVRLDGIIDTGGAGNNFFPGTNAGIIETGGQYV